MEGDTIMMEEKENLRAGLEAFQVGDWDMAVRELELATRDDPDDAYAFSFLGTAYVQQGRQNLAIGAFKKAAELDPKSARAHYNLAQACESAGVLTEAWFEYRKALELDPWYGLARGALAALTPKLERMRTQSMQSRIQA